MTYPDEEPKLPALESLELGKLLWKAIHDNGEGLAFMILALDSDGTSFVEGESICALLLSSLLSQFAREAPQKFLDRTECLGEFFGDLRKNIRRV